MWIVNAQLLAWIIMSCITERYCMVDEEIVLRLEEHD